jgi:hypothetical protein
LNAAPLELLAISEMLRVNLNVSNHR